MEFTLLFAAAIAVAAGQIALRWEAARGNAAECSADLWDLLLAGLVAGLFIGRLAAMVGTGVNPLTSLGDILIIRGGVATGPATLAGLATVAVLARTEIVAVLDGLAVAALATLGGWHLGCLARDACVGTPSDLPWAMTQAGSEVSRHPVELYAALMFLAAAVVLARIRKRGLRPGTAASASLLIAATGRLITEPVRVSLSGGPVWWYGLGIAAALVGLFAAQRR